MNDYDGDRNRVVEALRKLLRWEKAPAAQFISQWRISEVDDAAEHLRLVESAGVGLAAVVYAVRMRLAGSDLAKRREAAVEAGAHAAVIRKLPWEGIVAAPPPQPVRTYRDPE